MATNNVNLSTTNSITTTYAGDFSKKYIHAALLSANTVENGGVSVYPSIKYQQVISKIGLNDVLKDATCDFNATSTVTQTERILAVESLQVNLQLCKNDYVNNWDSMEMGYSEFDTLPKSFADYLIALVIEKVAAKCETNIWSGVTANAGEFDGFETLMTAQADQPAAQEIAGTTLSAANIIAQIRSAVDVIPTAVEGDPNLKIYMNAKSARFYVQALGGFGASGLGAAGGSDLPGPVLDTLERAVQETPDLAGHDFTAVDVYVGSQIGWGLQFGTIEKRKAFEDYWRRISSREAKQRADEIDNALLKD